MADNHGIRTERGLQLVLKWTALLSPPGDAGRYLATPMPTMKEQAASDSPLQSSRLFFRSYALRTLLLLVALVGVGCAVVVWRLREPSYPVVQISSPVVSPSGKQIAFVMVRGDKRSFDWQHSGNIDAFERFSKTIDVRLSIVSLSDGKTTNIGAEISSSSTPMTWAIDESHIVFVSGHIDETATTNYMGLDSINLATRTVTSIARPEIWMPQYSPDGTYLGYVRGNDLIVENIQTGQRTLLQSGVSHHYWCWSPSNSEVFYIKDGLIVCQYDLQTNSERTLFAALRADDKCPAHVVSSPDGTQLGYHFDNWFHIVDLKSGNTTKQFQCDHYFLDFDWNVTGICYVDAIEGERRERAQVMVFNPDSGKSSLVATGPFDHPRWLGNSQILVRKVNTELWSYGVGNGKSVKLYGPADEDE